MEVHRKTRKLMIIQNRKSLLKFGFCIEELILLRFFIKETVKRKRIETEAELEVEIEIVNVIKKEVDQETEKGVEIDDTVEQDLDQGLARDVIETESVRRQKRKLLS